MKGFGNGLTCACSRHNCTTLQGLHDPACVPPRAQWSAPEPVVRQPQGGSRPTHAPRTACPIMGFQHHTTPCTTQVNNQATNGAFGSILASSPSNFSLTTNRIPRYKTNTDIQFGFSITDMFGNTHSSKASVDAQLREPRAQELPSGGAVQKGTSCRRAGGRARCACWAGRACLFARTPGASPGRQARPVRRDLKSTSAHMRTVHIMSTVNPAQEFNPANASTVRLSVDDADVLGQREAVVSGPSLPVAKLVAADSCVHGPSLCILDPSALRTSSA